MSAPSKRMEPSMIKKKFAAAKSTQDGIQSTAHWMLAHKQQCHQIIHEWLTVLKASKPDRRLTLFYVCNEVVQTCKRKNATIYKDAFKAILKEATSYVRDASIASSVERIFRIWHERGIFLSKVLYELIFELNGESVQLTPCFQLPDLIESLNSMQKLDVDLELRRAAIINVNLDMTSQQIAKLFKDRQQGKALSSQIEECKQSIMAYLQVSDQASTDRGLLIDQLENAFHAHEGHFSEVKIVVNAYKNFGTRIRHLRTKLMARKKILPAPRDPIIPDTQPVDMELSDGEDENDAISAGAASNHSPANPPQPAPVFVETLTSPPSSPVSPPQSPTLTPPSPILIPSQTSSSTTKASQPPLNLPDLHGNNTIMTSTPPSIPIESIPLPTCLPHSKPPHKPPIASSPLQNLPLTSTSSHNKTTPNSNHCTLATPNSAKTFIDYNHSTPSSFPPFDTTFPATENKEPLNSRIERILKDSEPLLGNTEAPLEDTTQLSERAEHFVEGTGRGSKGAGESGEDSKEGGSSSGTSGPAGTASSLYGAINFNVLKNILQVTKQLPSSDHSPLACSPRTSGLSNNPPDSSANTGNSSEAVVSAFRGGRMEVREYNHSKVDGDEEDDNGPSRLSQGKLLSPLQFLNYYKTRRKGSDEHNDMSDNEPNYDDYVDDDGDEGANEGTQVLERVDEGALRGRRFHEHEAADDAFPPKPPAFPPKPPVFQAYSPRSFPPRAANPPFHQPPGSFFRPRCLRGGLPPPRGRRLQRFNRFAIRPS